MNSQYGFLLLLVLYTTGLTITASAETIQKTTGWCSPTVADVKSKVTIICNGINPKVLARLNELLDLKEKELVGSKIVLQDKIHEAEEWAWKYRELELRLATEGVETPLALKAKALLQEGKLEEAGKLLDQLLQSGEVEVNKIASHHYSRGQIFTLQFKFHEALYHYHKAYSYRPDNFEYANAYAYLLQVQKNFKDAEYVHLKNLDKIRKLSADNPAAYLQHVAGSLNNLGIIYTATQRLEEAESVFKESLSIYRKLSTGTQVAYLLNVAGTLNNLGNLYRDNNRLEEAEKAHLEALSIRRKLPADNPATYLADVAGSLNNLGNLYWNIQRLKEAEKSYKEALEIQGTPLGSGLTFGYLIREHLWGQA